MLLLNCARKVLWETRQEDLSKILFVFVGVLVVLLLLQKLRRFVSLPPGPWGFPVVGRMYHLQGDMHIHFRNLAKKYGTVCSESIGNHLFVVLSDYKIIRDMFRRDDMTGRPDTEFSKILGGYGKSNSEELIPKTAKIIIQISRYYGTRICL